MGSRIWLTTLAGAALGAASSIAAADPPAHAAAHHKPAPPAQVYIYYPSRELYYAPQRELWFWLDGGQWRSGAELPGYYRQYTYGGVRVDLDTERPYERHRRVRAQHPGY